MNWYLLGIGIYVVLLIGVSIYASKKVKTGDDFDLAGRSLPYWLLSFTFAGLWFGGGTLIGTTGIAFEHGFWSTKAAWGVIPDPYGAGLCLILAGIFYFSTLRRMGGVTLADFFEARFGKRAGFIATVVMIFGWVFFVASQVVVFGKILNSILDWPYNLSICIGMVLVILYTVAGGLWSVALTDMVQIIIILIGIVVAVPVGLHAVGGFSEIKATLPGEMLSFTPSFNPDISTLGRWLPWISGWMIIALGSIVAPDINQVAQAGATDRDVKRACATAGFIYWFFGSLVVLLGLIGATLVAKGTLSIEMLGGDSEMIMPVMIRELFPLPVAVLFVSAILGAVMSSADGALLALSTLFSRNILPFFRKKSPDAKKELFYNRMVVVIFAVLTTSIGISYPHAFMLMNFGFDSLLAGLFVPLTLGIYWKRTSKRGFFAGVSSGILVRVVLSGMLEGWTMETVMYPEKWYLYTMIAPIVNLVFTVLVSLMEKESDESQFNTTAV